MGSVTVSPGPSSRLVCFIAAGCCLLGARAAMAFPATDAATPSVVTNAPEPTGTDLRHQLQLVNGLGAGGGGGWTFVPSLSVQEAFSDNVLNTTFNRRSDLITMVTPGFSLD